jgi:hypothetical protein
LPSCGRRRNPNPVASSSSRWIRAIASKPPSQIAFRSAGVISVIQPPV